MTRRPSQQRGLLGPNPKSLGVEPLGAGQATRVVRIRATKLALDAFAALTADGRGAVVDAWHRAVK